MRFQLIGPWPGPGGAYYEGGMIIDASEPQWAEVVMPLNARALDIDAANALVRWHPFNQHLLHFAAGIRPTLEINV